MRTHRGYVKVHQPLRFGSILALIAVGAALSAGSAAITWASATGDDELRGPLDLTASGSQVAPALVPLAAAAVAALGAVLAARGALRRVVGGVTVVLGVIVAWSGIRGLLHEPSEVLFAATSSVTFADIRIRPLGPTMATVGGVLLVVAGLAVLTGRIRARTLGSRYERAGTTAAGTPSTGDPALDMWKDLDAHRDPTLDAPAPTGPDRSDGTPGPGTPRGGARS